ncbi:prepilin-type N-terminal cleavage/methylation domain-containing protein [uncultured Ezakiella sp.]|uniref:prepilin-type N-terminal cleavage/methylation domain-containing protein n=1 Tax=uncultured Ezakiella sp. TaxID=1637529 RepID=UPI0025F6AD86|nr:prepilin-type N-terminal cleavage/methylation domain-containing protein [uncultured Ezakiella sp.]
MINFDKKKDGFTFIELLIVILIISISFSSIALSLNAINKSTTDALDFADELIYIEKYIYECQASGCLKKSDIYNVSQVKNYDKINTYKLNYNKDGKELEILFSIIEK